MKLHELHESVETPLLISMLEKLRPKLREWQLYYMPVNATTQTRIVNFQWRKTETFSQSPDPAKHNMMELEVRTESPRPGGEPWVASIPASMIDSYTIRRSGERFVLTWKGNKVEDSHEGE